MSWMNAVWVCEMIRTFLSQNNGVKCNVNYPAHKWKVKMRLSKSAKRTQKTHFFHSLRSFLKIYVCCAKILRIVSHIEGVSLEGSITVIISDVHEFNQFENPWTRTKQSQPTKCRKQNERNQQQQQLKKPTKQKKFETKEKKARNKQH